METNKPNFCKYGVDHSTATICKDCDADQVAAETKDDRNNGDTYDEDSGEFLGRLTYTVGDKGNSEDEQMNLPPAKLSVYIDGYWYIYSMESKIKEEQNVKAPIDPNL